MHAVYVHCTARLLRVATAFTVLLCGPQIVALSAMSPTPVG